ncbi:MAG: NTP transferase domain-containing protein [Bacteroidota bacterium]
MSEKKHTKHTALMKPSGGAFHRNEWAIIGAPCGLVHQLVDDLSNHLQNRWKVGYLDADHKEPAEPLLHNVHYTDRIAYQQLRFQQKPGQKQYRALFEPLDALLVNGNHFMGDQQIVIVHEKKRASLERKLDRLTEVRMVLLADGHSEPFPFLHPYLPADVPTFLLKDTESIASFIEEELENRLPPLKGLVLAGGKSTRMGTDKGTLNYHGKPQREFLADLMTPFCDETWISLRQGQEAISEEYPILHDTFTGLGPFGAIVSAFREDPNAAWLTVAVDLPYLSMDSLMALVDGRNPSKLATCFHNPNTGFPEPLITIWEPRAYPKLLEFLAQGYSCPRKVLINTDVEEMPLLSLEEIYNANHPDEYRAAKEKLASPNAAGSTKTE